MYVLFITSSFFEPITIIFNKTDNTPPAYLYENLPKYYHKIIKLLYHTNVIKSTVEIKEKFYKNCDRLCKVNKKINISNL